MKFSALLQLELLCTYGGALRAMVSKVCVLLSEQELRNLFGNMHLSTVHNLGEIDSVCI